MRRLWDYMRKEKMKVYYVTKNNNKSQKKKKVKIKSETHCDSYQEEVQRPHKLQAKPKP